MKVLLVLLTTFSLQFANSKSIKLSTKNVCALEDTVDYSTMRAIKKCLVSKVRTRGSKTYPIYLYINSPGGSVYAGLKFIDFAKNIENLHTITEFSASMAAAIAQGIPGKRYITNSGIFMFHRASGSFRGQFESGEVESKLRLWKKIVRNMEIMQSKRIGITLRDYKKKRMNEWWLYSDENITNNTADEIIDPVCSFQLIDKKYTTVYRSFLGTRKVVRSRCPLVN